MTSIAALIIGLPERKLVNEALDSVLKQFRPVDDILIGLDPRRYGEAGNMNRLIDATDCDWIAFLHDDDLWMPQHIANAEHLIKNTDADILVSQFNLVGRDTSTIEPYHKDFADLMYTNWFPPSVVVARKEVFGHWIEGRAPLDDPWNDIYDNQGRVISRGSTNGYQLHSNNPWIDWANWRRLYMEGAKFRHTNLMDVEYRFFGDNGSWTAEQVAKIVVENVLQDPLASMRAAVQNS